MERAGGLVHIGHVPEIGQDEAEHPRADRYADLGAENRRGKDQTRGAAGPASQNPPMITPPTPIAIMNSGFFPNHLAMRDVMETATRNARLFETRNHPTRSSHFRKYLK